MSETQRQSEPLARVVDEVVDERVEEAVDERVEEVLDQAGTAASEADRARVSAEQAEDGARRDRGTRR